MKNSLYLKFCKRYVSCSISQLCSPLYHTHRPMDRENKITGPQQPCGTAMVTIISRTETRTLLRSCTPKIARYILLQTLIHFTWCSIRASLTFHWIVLALSYSVSKNATKEISDRRIRKGLERTRAGDFVCTDLSDAGTKNSMFEHAVDRLCRELRQDQHTVIILHKKLVNRLQLTGSHSPLDQLVRHRYWQSQVQKWIFQTRIRKKHFIASWSLGSVSQR